MNQKLFFLIIILAIVGVALFVRARNRRLHGGEAPAETAAAAPRPPAPPPASPAATASARRH
jgi:hypothetical protein